MFVVNKLNDFENHQIVSSYENSLVAKIFMFTFFNTFNSCFFIAFANDFFDGLHLCKVGGDTDVKDDCFIALKS